MDLENVTVTLGSLSFIIGLGMTIWNVLKNNKRDIQEKTSEYAFLKKTVQNHERDIDELKQDLKITRRELTEEYRKVEELMLKKIDNLDSKMDELKTILLRK